MDVGKTLTYTFDDEKWLSKLGLGALFSLVPILNFAWLGYYIEVMRNVTQGKELPLPEWDDVGDKFMKGLIVAVAGFIYALPGLIVFCGALGIMIIPAIIEDQDTQGAIAAVTSIAGLTLICCIGLYFLVFSFVFPAAQLRYSRYGTFQSLFQLGEVFRLISANVSDYLVAWVITLGAGLVVSFAVGAVGAILGWIPCLGQILTWAIATLAGVWASAVTAHLFGQVGAKAFADQ